MIQHHKTIDQPNHGLHGVLDNRDRHALSGELPDNSNQFFNFARAQSSQSFI